MTDLARIRTDLAEFSRAIGLDLASFQSRSLALRRRVTVVIAPRQSGKSRSIVATALWSAYRSPGQHVLLISAGERASRDLLATCRRVADSSPLLGPSVIDNYTAEMTFSNGSTIRSVPSSEAAIRGQSIDLLAVDECAQVPAELFYGAIWPVTAARSGAHIILCGTPGSPEGPLFEFARAGEGGDPTVETHRWRLEDAAAWIESSVVDSARQQLPEAVFSREYLGEFADVGEHERLIPREWIHAAQELTFEPDSTCVLGVDVARRGADSSVVCEARGQVFRIVHSTLGADTMKLAAKCAQLSREERGPPPTMAVDEVGVGGPVIDRLQELGVPVTGYNASHRAPESDRYANVRASSYWELRELFRLGEIDIDPADRQLADELAALTYKLDSAGRIQLADKSALPKSPDRADSLCITSWARGRLELGKQIRQMLDQAQRDREATAGRDPVLTESEFSRQPLTEHAFGRGQKRESIATSPYPVIGGVFR